MSIMINESVGRGGVNRKGDTRKIQKLLNAVFPATPLDETGEVDAKTIRRIERFQRRFLTNPDGRVDPGGKTLRRINESAPGGKRRVERRQLQVVAGKEASEPGSTHAVDGGANHRRTRTAGIQAQDLLWVAIGKSSAGTEGQGKFDG